MKLNAVIAISSVFALVGMAPTTYAAIPKAAAAKKTTVKRVAKKAVAKKAITAKAAVKPAVSPSKVEIVRPDASAKAVVAVAPAAGTTTAPIAEVKKEVAPKKFGFKYYTANGMSLKALSNEPGADVEVVASDKFTLSYKLTPNTSLALVQPVQHSWFGASSKNLVADTRLVAANSKLGALGWNMNLDGFTRYDIPVSTGSQSTESLGNGWLGMGITKEFGKFSMHPNVAYRYFFQQFETSKPNAKGEENQNLHYVVYTNIEFGFAATEKLSIDFATGIRNQVTYPDSNREKISKQADILSINPEISYQFTKTFGLAVGIYDEVDTRKLASNWVPFAIENDGEAYISASLAF